MESIVREKGGVWEAQEDCTVTITKGSVFKWSKSDETQTEIKTDGKTTLKKGDSIVSVEPYECTKETS